MNASYRWLKDFVDIDISPTELRDLLTARCATVDDVITLRQDLAGVVIGRVIEAGPHPDSDHLWVTKVDAGKGVLHDVVCGAPNVEKGRLYPFAPVGTVLPGGLKLEKRKIRGALSEGMLCSARELGLGTDHEGILGLDVDAQPGERFIDVVRVGDTRIVVDVLPNRPDLLSHEGLAREIAAATGRRMQRPSHPPAVLTKASNETGIPSVQVTVEDVEGSPRYMTAIVRGVTVGPSPEWLAARIEAVGGRSVSNVVDVTNYMLHGFGQPMHAFDLARLGGGQVVVRRARAGEKLETLDGVERTLDESMTVIADATTAQAIGGVIGGKGSEVTETTTDILLEAAAFDPQRIRATRRKLGVSTDASYRFERGVDASAIEDLLYYAAELVQRVAGGSLGGPATDSYQKPAQSKPIRVRLNRITTILGEAIPEEASIAYLSSIGFEVEPEKDALLVRPPSFRQDVTGEPEVIEEIARLHGYEQFSSELRPYRPGARRDDPMHTAATRVRDAVVAAGLFEARPMPFVREGIDAHRVRNPLAEDEAYLRTSLLESLARRVEYNFAHMQRNVRLFEIGTVFTDERVPNSSAPAERMHAAAVVVGDRRPAHFTEPHPPKLDEWDAKGLGELIGRAAFPGASIACAPGEGDVLWNVTADGSDVGSIRQLVVDAPVWASPVFGIEIDLEAVSPSRAATNPYVGIPSQPAMQVDLALLVPEDIRSAAVADAIRETAGDMLESLVVFDEFRGAGIPAGQRSLAWALTFRHPERTLRDREIQGRTAKILSVLESKLGIRQRSF
ncbi:MAG TPA: phenylalanine--tRNA ligase subunit beta [Gemmatimonadaceae bacterium]|nr:phenylalanine--tRNA ligase subunit beta [Gemmatimonadaceae bacterium]